MKNLKSETFWSQVDGSLVINLDDRLDRWTKAIAALSSFIPDGKFERLSAVNGKHIKGYGEKPWFRGREKDYRWAGRAGCTLSHRKAMQEGLKRGWDVFLILEDDICVREVPDDYLQRLSTLIFEDVTDWDMCYLGFTTPRGPAKTMAKIDPNSSLCQIRGARTTHAYLVKAPLARWLVEKLPKEDNIWSWCAGRRIIDRWYSRHISNHFKIVCTNPSFIIQAPSYSDLVGRVSDDWDSSKLISEVPESMKDLNFYRTRCEATSLMCRFNNFYDCIRGELKRLFGF
jgi:glycosyl transferase family 25